MTASWDDDTAMERIPTLSFLSTELIGGCWQEWADLRADQTPDQLRALQDAGSTFPSADRKVKRLYTSPGWIPLWSDPVRADYIGIDLDPDVAGASGQVINFGRNEERHFLCAPSFTALLEILLDEVCSGNWSPAIEDSLRNEAWLGDDHLFEALYNRAEGADGA